jgi:hypothetical protein
MCFQYHNPNSAAAAQRQDTSRFWMGSVMNRHFLVLLVVLCSIGIACRRSGTTTSEPLPSLGDVDQPLASFNQNLTSTTTSLTLHAGEDIKVPVRIDNPGTEIWASAGRLPVNVSYKWFKGADMLPIEGERTLLPASIGPKQTAMVDVRVIAPNEPGDYTLRITLVQEAVAWFMTKSNMFLAMPATVK